MSPTSSKTPHTPNNPKMVFTAAGAASQQPAGASGQGTAAGSVPSPLAGSPALFCLAVKQRSYSNMCKRRSLNKRHVQLKHCNNCTTTSCCLLPVAGPEKGTACQAPTDTAACCKCPLRQQPHTTTPQALNLGFAPMPLLHAFCGKCISPCSPHSCCCRQAPAQRACLTARPCELPFKHRCSTPPAV